MNHRLIARAIALIFFGILFAAYINHDHQKWRRAGREQFLVHEADRFDRTIIRVQPFSALATGSVLVVGFFGGLYEIVVLVLSAVLKSMEVPHPPQAGNGGIQVS